MRHSPPAPVQSVSAIGRSDVLNRPSCQLVPDMILHVHPRHIHQQSYGVPFTHVLYSVDLPSTLILDGMNPALYTLSSTSQP